MVVHDLDLVRDLMWPKTWSSLGFGPGPDYQVQDPVPRTSHFFMEIITKLSGVGPYGIYGPIWAHIKTGPSHNTSKSRLAVDREFVYLGSAGPGPGDGQAEGRMEGGRAEGWADERAEGAF